ncbi:MAG: hypothetical protein JXR83_16910 [Deltaproteobacteria bacterium]|nr:hypothetical protein [Deltaproteobacteria bacterium]
MGGVRLPDGRLVVGVPEENLRQAWIDPYGKHDVTLHELSHVVQDYCIGDDERRAIDQAYAKRREEGLPFTDSYASSNSSEYFAQAANVYFGRSQHHKNARWLQDNDPELYRLMSEIYPSNRWPDPPPGSNDGGIFGGLVDFWNDVFGPR